MTDIIILKNSSVSGKVPLVTDLEYGEVALNYADGKIYYRNTSDNISVIGGGVSSFKQDWTAGYQYNIGDTVRGPSGDVWLCTTSHISTYDIILPVEPDISNQYWLLYSAKGKDAVVFNLNPSTTTITRDAAGQYTHDILYCSATYITSGTQITYNYSGLFRVHILYNDGTGLDTIYYSSTNTEHQCNIVIPPDCKEILISLYQANSQFTNKLSSTTIPVLDDAVSYKVEIESVNGTHFRVGNQQTTQLIAHVFRNDIEVTNELPSSWFRWTRVSAVQRNPPYDDETWNQAYISGYKQILINVDDVLARATYHCQIIK